MRAPRPDPRPPIGRRSGSYILEKRYKLFLHLPKANLLGQTLGLFPYCSGGTVQLVLWGPPSGPPERVGNGGQEEGAKREVGTRSEQLPTRPKELIPRRPTSRQPIGGSRHRTAGKKRLRGKAELCAHSANPLCPKALLRGEGNAKRDFRVGLPEVGFLSLIHI